MPTPPYLRIAFFVCLLLGIMPLISRAQTVFEGKVVDKTTENPIPGVTVKLAKEKEATGTTWE